MSIESARLFVDRMNTDEEFAQKVTECKDTESRIKFVKAAGFDFTVTEVKEVMGELSDEDLDQVTAGNINVVGRGNLGCVSDPRVDDVYRKSY
jgi:predicted ribosomally synthesized peptide with nif11-like leader